MQTVFFWRRHCVLWSLQCDSRGNSWDDSSPVTYVQHFAHGRLPLPGCSLQAYVAILEPRGYILWRVDLEDAWFVRSDAIRDRTKIDAFDLWAQGSFCHPSARFRGVEWFDWRRLANRNFRLSTRLGLLKHVLTQMWQGRDGYSISIWKTAFLFVRLSDDLPPHCKKHETRKSHLCCIYFLSLRHFFLVFSIFFCV